MPRGMQEKDRDEDSPWVKIGKARHQIQPRGHPEHEGAEDEVDGESTHATPRERKPYLVTLAAASHAITPARRSQASPSAPVRCSQSGPPFGPDQPASTRHVSTPNSGRSGSGFWYLYVLRFAAAADSGCFRILERRAKEGVVTVLADIRVP